MRRLALLFLLLPGAALAHASERMVILTLPTRGYVIGAALTVALTAVLGMIARRPPHFGARALFTRPALLPREVSSWVGAGLTILLVVVGLSGTHDPMENLLPLTLWTVVWVGLTLASVIFGNLWRDVAPWYGPVRTIRHLIGRTGSIGLARLGYLPAILGYLAFAWFEMISLSPADPEVLARAVVLYAALILTLGVLEGEDWLDRGDFLSGYFAMVSRIAPFWAEYEGRRVTVMAGLPGAQVVQSAPLTPSAIAFVTLLLASVSFDGLHETFWWLARLGINPLDFPGRSAVVWQNTFGLLSFWAFSAALILGAIRFGLPKGTRFSDLAGPLMLSFLPIAAGYHVAHYFISLLTGGQYAIAALNDPFSTGLSLLGLPEHWVSFGFLSTHSGVRAVWSFQFAAILGAHVLAVLLSLRLTANIERAQTFRTHAPMTLLMIAYTVFGLWLLSTPTGA